MAKSAQQRLKDKRQAKLDREYQERIMPSYEEDRKHMIVYNPSAGVFIAPSQTPQETPLDRQQQQRRNG